MAWVNLNTIYATKSEVNSKVPNTRTINGKALSSNVTLGASDIKLSDDTTLQSAWDSISHALKTSKLTLPNVYIGDNTATKVSVSWSVDFVKIKAVFLTYVCHDSSDRIVLSDYDSSSITLRGSVKQYIGASLTILHE